MRVVRIFVLLIAVGVIFGALYGFVEYKNAAIASLLASRANPVVIVTAEPVRQETWQDTVSAIGTLKAINGVDVNPEVAGVVTAINFTSGNMVKKGDTLVQLDADIETANRNSALAQLKIAQDNYDRSSKLVLNRDVTEQTLAQFRFQVQNQQATVKSLDAQIAQKNIRAPFDGQIGISNIDLGQFLQPGTPIATLQDISSLQIEFSVPQKNLPDLANGQQVSVTSDARPGTTFKGKLTSFDPRVDPNTGMIACEGLVPNPGGALLPGMFVEVTLDKTGTQSVLTTSQAAVSYNLFGNYVYIVSPPAEGAQHPTVKQALVTLGERRDDRLAISKGVSPGDQVVTSGQLKLANGTPVQLDTTPQRSPDVAQQNY